MWDGWVNSAIHSDIHDVVENKEQWKECNLVIRLFQLIQTKNESD